MKSKKPCQLIRVASNRQSRGKIKTRAWKGPKRAWGNGKDQRVGYECFMTSRGELVKFLVLEEFRGVKEALQKKKDEKRRHSNGKVEGGGGPADQLKGALCASDGSISDD